ncbi:MAG: hypothetical protein D6739_00135, partial [Nitrospirae bacterium]
MKPRFLHLAALLALLLAPQAAAQGVPPVVTLQGLLLDAAGNPLAGPADLELAIYDAASGGTLLYAESHPAVPLSDGVYVVQLGGGAPSHGSFGPALFARPGRWLEITVNGEVQSPRRRLAAAPWAVAAANA